MECPHPQPFGWQSQNSEVGFQTPSTAAERRGTLIIPSSASSCYHFPQRRPYNNERSQRERDMAGGS